MSRIAFWVILALVIYLAIVFARSRRASGEKKQIPRKKNPNAPVAMIECPQCGTHFPEDEAVLGDGVAYCSERCRKAARAKRAKS